MIYVDTSSTEAARSDLAGHDLACWRRTGPCHVDVLLDLANSKTPSTDNEDGR